MNFQNGVAVAKALVLNFFCGAVMNISFTLERIMCLYAEFKMNVLMRTLLSDM